MILVHPSALYFIYLVNNCDVYLQVKKKGNPFRTYSTLKSQTTLPSKPLVDSDMKKKFESFLLSIFKLDGKFGVIT